MSNYEHQWYSSPISIPEGQKGRMSIRHVTLPAGTKEPIVSPRQAITRGIVPTYVALKEPLRIHELREQATHRQAGGILMTDRPQELDQISEMLHDVRPRGRVLVGGLGLGIVATAVERLKDVEQVTVVERSADVVELTARHIQCGVVVSDICAYLRRTKRPFDCYLLDTWSGTSESTWWSEVLPLLRIIRGKFGIEPTIHCWAEDMMQGQISRSLSLHGTAGKPGWYYTHLPCPMSREEASAFLSAVGTREWEKKYGAAIDRWNHEGAFRRRRKPK